jgi:ATP-binding cassette, subfamily B, bacterial PglK
MFKALTVLSRNQKKLLPVILLLMLSGAALEVVGLSLVIPLLEIITNKPDNKVYTIMIDIFPNMSREKTIHYILILFTTFYILKNAYLFLLVKILAKYSFSIKADINNRLMKCYVNAPYDFHLGVNSAQLIRNVTIETTQLVGNALNPLLTFTTEVMIIISLAIFLVFIEPVGTTVAILMLIFSSYIFQRLIRNRLIILGRLRQKADGFLIQTAQEALGGLKDVRVNSSEDYFFDRFAAHNSQSASSSEKQFAWVQSPRMYLEAVAIITLAAILFLLQTDNQQSVETVTKMGVFGLAAFRLLPSANRVLSAMNSLRFSTPVVEKVIEQLNIISNIEKNNNNEKVSYSRIEFVNQIDIENVSYAYPEQKSNTLNDVSFSFTKGECIGVIGKSGSGKTTLVDIILGLLSPSHGTVCVDGVNINKALNDWRGIVGYVPQDVFLLDDNVQKNIAFGINDKDIDQERLEQVLKDCELYDFVMSLPSALNTQLGERGIRLSGGQKQRLGIARALYKNASILILDEATSALDSTTEKSIVDAINLLKGETTSLVIAHRLSTLANCDRIIELDNGAVQKIYNSSEIGQLIKN